MVAMCCCFSTAVSSAGSTDPEWDCSLNPSSIVVPSMGVAKRLMLEFADGCGSGDEQGAEASEGELNRAGVSGWIPCMSCERQLSADNADPDLHWCAMCKVAAVCSSCCIPACRDCTSSQEVLCPSCSVVAEQCAICDGPLCEECSLLQGCIKCGSRVCKLCSMAIYETRTTQRKCLSCCLPGRRRRVLRRHETSPWSPRPNHGFVVSRSRSPIRSSRRKEASGGNDTRKASKQHEHTEASGEGHGSSLGLPNPLQMSVLGQGWRQRGRHCNPRDSLKSPKRCI